MSSRDFFLGKRIAVIGLGPHGEMSADIRFLIKANALVSVYDIRAEARVRDHLDPLRAIGLANYVCGSIPADDLLDMELIVLSHEYSRESSFLAEARAAGIQIEYPETLFMKLVPPINLIGVMGACGKTTAMSMLEPMLEAAVASEGSHQLFVSDPEGQGGLLAHLKKAKSGDLVLLRISDAMMLEIAAMGMSPQAAVFTTVPAHGTYRRSPFDILSGQTYNSYVVASDDVIDSLKASGLPSRGRLLRTKPSLIPDDWAFKARAPHDRENAALALQAARIFKVKDADAREALAKWKPLKGRMEPIKKVKQIEFYNDAASVSPDSTVSAMASMGGGRNLVVIAGGADRGGDYRSLFAALPRYAHTLIVLPGSGTLRERGSFRKLDQMEVVSVPTIEEAARSALEHAKKGDRVLFSPGFDAGGFDASRTERGERFVKAVKALS